MLINLQEVYRALYWPDLAGAAVDLNDVIPSDSGWVLHKANAINDAGQIIGQGTRSGLSGQRSFLLTPIGPPQPADLDGDGQVDAADLGLLLGAWGPCAAPCDADLDGDGTIDGADLGLLLAAWAP
jgi:hypothetical protein